MIKGNSFRHPHMGNSFSKRGRITCRTTFVCLLKCLCGFCHVCTTKTELRINKHKSNIRNHDVKLFVTRLFKKFGHEVCTETSRHWGSITSQSWWGKRAQGYLLQQEAFCIHRLQTVHPNGPHEELVLNVFIYLFICDFCNNHNALCLWYFYIRLYNFISFYIILFYFMIFFFIFWQFI